MFIFYPTREAARQAKEGKLIDFGKDAPKGKRYAREVEDNQKPMLSRNQREGRYLGCFSRKHFRYGPSHNPLALDKMLNVFKAAKSICNALSK